MSSEVSIAKPLSGTECLEAILYRLRETFSKDERFFSHMAYTGFTAKIGFEFFPQNSFIPPVQRELSVSEGEIDDLSETPTIDETITLDLAPPNKVREDADLPTPIPPEIEHLESVVYAKDQPEYIPLPVSRTQDGAVVTCWKLNWRERIRVALGANFYLTLLTFNQPLTPMRVEIEKPVYRLVD